MSDPLEENIKSPKVEKELTDVQKFKLVELVGNHPVGSREYRLQEEERRKLDVAGRGLQAGKLASLSTYHTSAKNKVKNASGADAEDASSKWKFWYAFAFLRSEPSTEERISNMV
uniref:Uncharacterized protein n=1 Tax=Ditylenchus dipsaci TaxID=166011 RepID=A0A915CQZ7_9BILA